MSLAFELVGSGLPITAVTAVQRFALQVQAEGCSLLVGLTLICTDLLFVMLSLALFLRYLWCIRRFFSSESKLDLVAAAPKSNAGSLLIDLR